MSRCVNDTRRAPTYSAHSYGEIRHQRGPVTEFNGGPARNSYLSYFLVTRRLRAQGGDREGDPASVGREREALRSVRSIQGTGCLTVEIANEDPAHAAA